MIGGRGWKGVGRGRTKPSKLGLYPTWDHLSEKNS